MKNIKIEELDELESKKIDGGLILASPRLLDKGLRYAGVYDAIDGFRDGWSECADTESE